jgi:hypothetical protein
MSAVLRWVSAEIIGVGGGEKIKGDVLGKSTLLAKGSIRCWRGAMKAEPGCFPCSASE